MAFILIIGPRRAGGNSGEPAPDVGLSDKGGLIGASLACND